MHYSHLMHINDVYMLVRWSLRGVLRYVMNYNYMFKFPIALPASLREEQTINNLHASHETWREHFSMSYFTLKIKNLYLHQIK